jgi:hypothetical protein
MGLDIIVVETTTVERAWSSAYSTFGAFRKALAEAEGFDLNAMEGVTADGRSWDEIDSPLVPLLSHSDCDGQLHPYEYEREMFERLREIIRVSGFDYYWHEWGERLADALEKIKDDHEYGNGNQYLEFA